MTCCQCCANIMVRITFRFSRNVLNVFAGMDYYYVGQQLRLMIEFLEGEGSFSNYLFLFFSNKSLMLNEVVTILIIIYLIRDSLEYYIVTYMKV